MNQCTVCGQDFGSVSAFDDHRVGGHEHTHDDEHPDGRRCLTPAEILAAGMRKDTRGRWRLPQRGEPPWTSDVRPQKPPEESGELGGRPAEFRASEPDTSLLEEGDRAA